MSKGIKTVHPKNLDDKNIKRIDSINEIPTFEIEAEESVQFEVLLEEVKNNKETEQNIKWVWSWYNNGLEQNQWGDWNNKSASQAAIESKNIKTNYAKTKNPSVIFGDDDIDKIVWLEAFVYSPEGPKGKDSKGVLLKVKANPKITDIKLLLLGAPYINKPLAYDQYITVQIGIYNKAAFGELIVEVWNREIKKKLYEEKLNLSADKTLVINYGTVKAGLQTKTQPIIIENITHNIFINDGWRKDVSKISLAEYELKIFAVPVQYSETTKRNKSNLEIQKGDIINRGSNNISVIKNTEAKKIAKEDRLKNEKRWSGISKPFYVVYNTNDELYQHHNEEINNLVQIKSKKLKAINSEPCSYNKIFIKDGESKPITVFEEKSSGLFDITNVGFPIVRGDKNFAKDIIIEVSGYTQGKFCKSIVSHANIENVLPALEVHGYDFNDQAWFKNENYKVILNSDKISLLAKVYYPYEFTPYEKDIYPIKYFLLGLVEPFKVAIPVSTCRYQTILIFDVYPDIEWEVAFLITVGAGYKEKMTFKRDDLRGFHKGFGFKMIKDEIKEDVISKGGLSYSLAVKYSINNKTHNNQFQFGFVHTIDSIIKSYTKVSGWLQLFNSNGNELDSVAYKKNITNKFEFNIDPPNIALALRWKYGVAKNNGQAVIIYTGAVALKPLIGVKISVDLITLLKNFSGVAREIIDWAIDFIAWLTKADLYIMFDTSIALNAEINLSYNKIDGFDPETKQKVELELGCALRAGIKSKAVIFVAVTKPSRTGESQMAETEQWKAEGIVQTSVKFTKEYGYDAEKGSYHITEIIWLGAEMIITVIYLTANKRGIVTPQEQGKNKFNIRDSELIYNSKKIFSADEKK